MPLRDPFCAFSRRQPAKLVPDREQWLFSSDFYPFEGNTPQY
jgi:hypothetical protein